MQISTIPGQDLGFGDAYTVLSFRAEAVPDLASDQGNAPGSAVVVAPNGPTAMVGLAIIEQTVDSVGGALYIRRSVLGATEYHAVLPTDPSGSVKSRQGGARLPKKAGSGAKILLLEDNVGVRDVLARQLRRAGFTVVAVGTGEEGERAFGGDPTFDLLLLDVVVPGALQGPELAERLLAQKADLRVLYITGFYADGQELGHRTLQKPVAKGELVRAVRQELSLSN